MAAPGTIGNLVAPGEDNTNRKIEDLTRALKELAPSVMETILPLITSLQEQQDVLEAQQAEILALVNTQVSLDTGWANSASPVNMTLSETTIASFSLAIPTGYTRAMVIVNGSLGVVNPSGSASSFATRVYAQPSGGTMEWGPRRWLTIEPGYDGAAFSQLYQAYTGLSGGTFNFWLNVINAGGSDWGSSSGGGTVEALAIFLR